MNQARRRLALGLGAAALAGASPLLMGNAKAIPVPKPSVMTVPQLTIETDEPAIAAATASQMRRLYVHNLHTGETLDAVYYENGSYVADALASAMQVLRDWRNGAEHYMDPRLFDTLHQIHSALEVKAPFQIISGFRSKQTNAVLHEHSKGVASNSQHTLGKAVDVRLEGVELTHLHKAALAVGAGGVGFYPVSDFVHVDVGPVRQWSGV